MAASALRRSLSRPSQGLYPTHFARSQPRLSLRASFCNASAMSGALARSVLFKLELSAFLFLIVATHAEADQAKNVLGGPLEVCCTSPMTGFYRDGYCRVGTADRGVHAVCAKMTQEFMDFTALRGNDLSSVVSVGQKWCLCVSRWQEAKTAGKAPPVFLRATAEDALQAVSLEDLEEHAVQEEGSEL